MNCTRLRPQKRLCRDRAAWQEALENLLLLLAPFAPHITEELWHDLGHKESIHLANWPVFDPALLVEDTVTYAIQVNGKLRGEVSVAADADKDSVAAAAQEKSPVIWTALQLRRQLWCRAKSSTLWLVELNRP